MAVFESTKHGGLLLKSYDSESITADPAVEASRIIQTRGAIGSLVQRLKLGKAKVRYAISGQSVFTRFVKLPPLQAENIEQLVTFEAQQHVPVPINEAVWDYELLESQGAEKEVVLVAIKSDALDEINDAVTASGVSTAVVDVAPMALYNAYRNAYGQSDEPVLLVDIGAKTSNLLYIEGKRFFTRSIAIGGISLTSAIAKEYGVSFNEAEVQKVANGLVALAGGHTEQLEESVAALAMVIRNALTRLPAEIARTTNYYRSQHGGNAPRRVILAGGGASLPYVQEFFAEKLHLPVEFFNPLQNVAIGKGVDVPRLQREAHLMGELVGLGLRGTGKAAINIDLVPASVEQLRVEERRKPFLIGAAAIFLAGVGAWAGLQSVAAGKAKEKNDHQAETQAALAPIADEIQGLLKKENELKRIASGYTDAVNNQTYWLDLLSELRGAFASDAVWITDVEPLSGYDPQDPASKPASLIKAEFAGTAYGTSPINVTSATAPTTDKGGRPQTNAAPAEPTANAIRIRGLWRENAKSQNVVYDLLKRLRSNPGHFRFTVTDAKGKQTELKDEQIVKSLTATQESGDLALPFELVLPLEREVRIK